MEESFGPFLDCLYLSSEYDETKDLKYIVVSQVVNELEKHTKSDSLEQRVDAKRAIRFLKMDRRGKKLLTIDKVRGVEDFADAAIYSSISGLRINKKVLLITQDKTLADDVRKLNSLDSQHGKYVSIYKVDPTGILLENKGNLYGPLKKEQPRPVSARQSFTRDQARKDMAEKKAAPSTKPAEKEEAKKERPGKNLPAIPDGISLLDRAISSNVNNPSYPLARKLDDIERQIKNLSSYENSQISSWKLLYDYDDLLEAKGRLIEERSKAAEETEAKKEEPKKEAAPVKEESPKAKEKQPVSLKPSELPKTKRQPFGKGDTFVSSLKDLLSRYGTMIRDDGVPYVKAIHGPYNFVMGDFSKLIHDVALLPTPSSKDAAVKDVLFHIEKNAGDYRVTLEEKKPEPVATKPAEVKKPAQKESKKTEKPVQAAPKAKDETPAVAKAPAPKKTGGRKVAHSDNYEAAIKADRDLKSKLNNPTYPVESKIKDIEDQEARVRTLKQSELKDLTYTIRGLQKAAKSLLK